MALESKKGQLEGINENWMKRETAFSEKSETKPGTGWRSELNVCCFLLRLHLASARRNADINNSVIQGKQAPSLTASCPDFSSARPGSGVTDAQGLYPVETSAFQKSSPTVWSLCLTSDCSYRLVFAQNQAGFNLLALRVQRSSLPEGPTSVTPGPASTNTISQKLE